MAVSTMQVSSDSSSSKQVLLGWRLGVSLSTKPSQTPFTLLFTKECHNVDMNEQQKATDALLILIPERKNERK